MTATIELNAHATERGIVLPTYRPLPIPAIDLGEAESWAQGQGWTVCGWVRTSQGYRALVFAGRDPIGRLEVQSYTRAKVPVFCSTFGCSRQAAGMLCAPDGYMGGAECLDHAREIIHEMWNKIGEEWNLVPKDHALASRAALQEA